MRNRVDNEPNGLGEASTPWLASRRHCFVGLTVTFVSMVNGALFAASPGAERERALLASLNDPAKARALGRAYLRTLPTAERSTRRLAGAVYEALGAMPTDPTAKLRVQVRREFAEGSVITVDGWCLSLTEVRIYAIAALS